MNILVVGLRNKDISRLKKLKSLRITHVTSDNISNRSLKHFKDYDVVINVCKFSAHLVEYLCNSHKNFIRLRPTQGVSSLNTLLKDFAHE